MRKKEGRRRETSIRDEEEGRIRRRMREKKIIKIPKKGREENYKR